MTHVAMFTDSYGPSRNGVTIAVEQLRDHLVASSHEVTVFAPGRRILEVRTFAPNGTEYLLGSIKIPGLHPRIATGLGFRSCLRALGRSAPDVVHVQGFGPVSMLGVYFARRSHTPLLITWHTDIAAYATHYRYLLPVLWFWALVVRAVCGGSRNCSAGRGRAVDRFAAAMVSTAELVMAPSEKIARKLRALCARATIVTIPTGVDPIIQAATSTAVPAIAGPMLLYVGRIAPEKGIRLLLDAFEILSTWLPEATLVMVGDYSCARGLKSRLRTAWQQNIVLTGELERERLAPLYARADVFVFPSVTDTQGLVLQEAAHAGVPLVVVDSELGSPVIDERTTTVSEPVPHTLATAIARTLTLAKDAQWSTSVRQAAMTTAAHCSSAAQCEKVAEIYQRCVKGVDGRRQTA